METAMRWLFGIGLLLSCLSCSHAEIVGFEKDEVTVCHKRGDYEKMQIKAVEYCHTPKVAVLKGFQNRELSGVSTGSGFMRGTATVNYSHEMCVVYKCGG
jgi:hypothetical protein